MTATFPLAAQLTQATHAPAVGDPDYSMIRCDSVGPGPNGPGIMWDFSTLPTNTNIVTTFSCRSSNDWDYPSATHSVGTNRSDIFFYTSSLGSLKLWGRYAHAGTSPGHFFAELNYTTAATAATYPMNYSASAPIGNCSGIINIVSPVFASGSFTGKSKAIIDATGTLTLPGATESFTDVVRVVTSHTLNYSASPYTGTITMIDFNYFAKSIKAPIFSIHTTTATTQLGVRTRTIVGYNRDAEVPKPPDETGIVKQGADVSNVVVYPNPSTGFVYFSCEGCNDKTLEVHDISGRSVDRLNLNAGEIRLDVSHYNKGLYYYSVFDKTKRLEKTGKIIVSP